ncbi:MAG: hypothetical protein AB1486_14255 [Planctomycetota bacterium]
MWCKARLDPVGTLLAAFLLASGAAVLAGGDFVLDQKLLPDTSTYGDFGQAVGA